MEIKNPSIEEETTPITSGVSRADAVKLVLLSWLAMVGFDFLLHGGILADIYSQPAPFVLPPEQAFAFIPLGYLSFLLLAVLLVWLMPRLGIASLRGGARFGLVLGVLIWGSFILGLISISTVPLSLAAGWFLGQSLELALGGAVVGYGLETRNYRRLFFAILLIGLASFIMAIVFQNI